MSHPAACGCRLCTGAVDAGDLVRLRIVDVQALQVLMAEVQAGYCAAARRQIERVTEAGMASTNVWILSDHVDGLLRKLLAVHPDAPDAGKVRM